MSFGRILGVHKINNRGDKEYLIKINKIPKEIVSKKNVPVDLYHSRLLRNSAISRRISSLIESARKILEIGRGSSG